MQNVKWALIGCGDIARKRVAPALRETERSELVAVSRANLDLLESFAREFGARRWYPAWEDAIVDYEVDAIYVATPVHLHAPQCIAAANAGKHVLCEKPMAMNAAECERIISAANDNNVRLGISYYRHFFPVIGRIKELISAGTIGKPIMAQLNAFEWFDPEAGHPRAWLLKRSVSGGGPMFDFGCHRIQVLLNLFGPIERTIAIRSNALFDREVEDTAVACFQFRQGISATLAISHAAREPQDTLDIFGSEGSIHVPVLNGGRLRVIDRDGEHDEFHPPAPNIHRPLIEDFVDAVLNEREPLVSGQIGKAVATVEDEIYSARG